MPDIGDLRQKQALPLTAKVHMTQARIYEWYKHWEGNVCVSFSGGKDSTVLAHLVHDIYPDVPLVFSNTGLEYPEIQSFARKMGAVFVRPKMRFDEVISTYGYPIISKEVAEVIDFARRIRNAGKETETRRKNLTTARDDDNHKNIRRKKIAGGEGFENKKVSTFSQIKWLPLCQETNFLISGKCCSKIKKTPLARYQRTEKRVPIVGTMAEESQKRKNAWLKNGCNAFESKSPISQPMAFWTEQDVLKYIRQEGLEIASVYGDVVGVDEDGMEYEPIPGVDCRLKCTGCQRTGFIFCGFGAYLDKGEQTRFQMLAKTHPRQYEYCMGGGQWVDNPHYDPVAPEYDGEWKNWNPKKIWVPSKEGLGMKKVFDDCNQIYGKDFIRYE